MLFQTKFFNIILILLWGAGIAWIGINKANPEGHNGVMEVRLRSIGHDILSAIGDDSSRVMPIEKKSASEYLIRFENELAFTPDSIVDIVRKYLDDSLTNSSYLLQVMECSNHDIVYSFSIAVNENNNLIPCIGRKLPTACYFMSIKFLTPAASKGWQATAIILPTLFLIGFLYFKKRLPPKNESPTDHGAMATFGKFKIDSRQQCLFYQDEKILLSGKEYELLQLFIQSPNQLLERNYLLKTIWEDQGVIVGRSLDVFVSKLRKKLSLDENLKLISVHGKGYMLGVAPLE